MLVLFCLVSILILPFKSKCRLEAENVALRHQVMVLRRQVERVGSSHEPRSVSPGPALPLVSVDPASSRHRSAGDRRSLASVRLSLLLALEITLSGRAAADRRGAARFDPADEQ